MSELHNSAPRRRPPPAPAARRGPRAPRPEPQPCGAPAPGLRAPGRFPRSARLGCSVAGIAGAALKLARAVRVLGEEPASELSGAAWLLFVQSQPLD